MRADQIVDRNIKEALNLRCMQIHRQNAVRTGDRDEVGNQLGGDGIAAFGLAVLPGIAEIRDDGRDAAGGGTTHRIDHDEQLHQAVIDRVAGGLNNKNVLAAYRFVNRNRALPVRKLGNAAVAGTDKQRGTDIFCQRGIGISGENCNFFTV